MREKRDDGGDEDEGGQESVVDGRRCRKGEGGKNLV